MPASSNPSQPAKPTRDPKPQPSRRRTRLRLAFLLGTGLVLAFLAAWMRPHLVDAFKTRSLLALDSIDPDTLESHLGEVPDAEATLETFWASGKISHRRAVLGYVTRPGAPTNGLRTRIVAKAMADADLDIRERAFGTLHTPDVTGLDQMIGPQLTDPDPEVRRLGIQTLRRVGHAGWTPAVRPLLSDPEPSLVLGADSLLRRWTGRDSGLRLADALPGQHGILPSDHALTPETRERLRGSVAVW
ncbi:MAG: HEAT repeat domain-containing protein, partial [Limisphaerales bacterium]